MRALTRREPAVEAAGSLLPATARGGYWIVNSVCMPSSKWALPSAVGM